MKRIVSLIVTVLMVLSLLPSSIFTVNAATTLTEQQFAAKIAALQKEYPEDKYWSNKNGTVNSGTYKGTSLAGNTKCGTSAAWTTGCGTLMVNGTELAWQCHGYALLMGYKIFGSNANNWTKYTSKSRQIYAGDVIRIDINGNGINEDTNDHTIFVYRVTSTHIYYTDCNSTGPCQIRWDGSMTLSALRSKMLYIRHLNGNELTGNGTVAPTLTIQYSANGGTIPAIHSYKVTTSDSVLRLRKEPSLSATTLTQIPNGETFNATATATADGYTWAKTTYGGYTGWCAVSGGLATRLGYYLQSDNIYQYSDSKLRTQKWKYGEGGTNGLINDTTFAIQKEGCTFVGWSLSKDGSTTVFDQDKTSLKAEDICTDVKNGSQTVTLYAIWKSNAPATLTFQYQANGGTGSMAASTAFQGSTLVLKSNSFTKTGYDFMGWNIQRQDGAWYADNGVWCAEDVLSSKGYGKALLQNGASIALSSTFVTLSGDHNYTLCAVWRDNRIQNIYVESMANKTQYYVSDSVNSGDLVLTVKYKDGSFATITEGFTCSPETLTSEGYQLVTVTYEGVSTAYTLPVTAVKSFKKNAKASAKKDCYLLPNTSAEKFLYTWTGDELTILCKDGDFYLGFYPWMDEKITEANGVLAYIPKSCVTLNSGVTVPDASSYYSINRSGTVTASTKVYHRTNTSSVVTSSNVDRTVIATLNTGEKVKVLFEMNGYYCIQTSSYTGFIAKTAVALNPALCGIQCNVGSMTATMGEAINTSVVRVEAVYADGSSVAVTDYSLSLPSTATAGTKYAMIHYGGFVTYFIVEVVSPIISDISIQTAPTKDKYLIGDSFEPAGMTVQAIYENGTEENIPLSSLQYQYNFAEPGYTTVRVEYMGQYADVMVLVYTPPVFKIGDVAGYIGEKVNVPVLCKSEDMYIDGYSLAMTVTYDTAALQYRGFTASEYIEGTRLVVNPSESGKLVIAYAHDSSLPLNTLLMELQFTIVAESSVHSIGFDNCEFYDGKSVPYALVCENGSITNLGYVEVNYCTGEGIAAPEQQAVTYGQQIVVPNYIPVKDGYTFSGWSLMPDSDSVDYEPGDTIDCLHSITLYAVWEAKFVGQWGAVLEDDLKVRFHLNVDSVISASAKIRVSFGEQVCEYSVSELPMLEQGKYLLTVNVAPAEMMEDIVVQLVDNNTIIKEATHTVREYCDTILADEGHSQYHALVKEMLNYGAMAQVYFNYDTENLANDGITDTAAIEVPETAEEITVSDKISGLSFYGASLVYRDRIAVRYYFTGDVTDCTFTANGNTYTPVAKDGMHYVEIADIVPQDLDQQITVTVSNAEGNTLTVSYSPMNYIVRMNQKGSEAVKNLVKALYNYHLAAKALRTTV